MGRTFVTGDTHGTYDIDKLYSFKRNIGKTLTKKDKVIILGDWGGIFNPRDDYSDLEKIMHTFYDEAPWTTIAILGNHENYNKILKLPKIEKYGGLVYQGPGNVDILERGAIYTINNNTIWTMGGGLSIDKNYRIKDISWWDQEHPSREELNRGIDVLSDALGTVDYVLTHTGPIQLIQEFFGKGFNSHPKYKDPLSAYFDEIYSTYLINYKHWYCGHFHEDIKNSDLKFTIVYQDIIELK